MNLTTTRIAPRISCTPPIGTARSLAAVALALAGPAAFAQSSVTLYGIIDLDNQILSGHSNDVLVTSGGQSGSRLGFKGSEDLGAGYFADFVLEAGFNADTGGSAQGGQLFGRQAFGALRTPFGTLSAGRQYSSIFTQTSEFSEFANVGVGASTAVIGGFAGGYEPVRGGANNASTSTATGSQLNGSPLRVNNSVRYTTPAVAGFKASILYAAGEVTGDTNGTRLFDYSLRYADHGLDVLVSYVDDKATNAAVVDNSRTRVSITTASAGYTFGSFKLEGGYLDLDDKRPTDLDGHGFWLGGDFKQGRNVFRLQWVQNKPLHTTIGKTNAIGAGYEFDFSKRTNLYTSYTRFQNSGTGPGRIAGPIPAGLTVPGDTSVSEYVLGIRHSF